MQTSISDLSDYYRTLDAGRRHDGFNPLGPTWSIQDLLHYGSPSAAGRDPASLVQPCLRSLAMGDSKAVPLAQAAHCAVLAEAGVEAPDLENGRPAGAGKVHSA